MMPEPITRDGKLTLCHQFHWAIQYCWKHILWHLSRTQQTMCCWQKSKFYGVPLYDHDLLLIFMVGIQEDKISSNLELLGSKRANWLLGLKHINHSYGSKIWWLIFVHAVHVLMWRYNQLTMSMTQDPVLLCDEFCIQAPLPPVIDQGLVPTWGDWYRVPSSMHCGSASNKWLDPMSNPWGWFQINRKWINITPSSGSLSADL